MSTLFLILAPGATELDTPGLCLWHCLHLGDGNLFIWAKKKRADQDAQVVNNVALNTTFIWDSQDAEHIATMPKTLVVILNTLKRDHFFYFELFMYN